jgi:VWFA-related protein
MKTKTFTIFAMLLFSAVAFPQSEKQKPAEEQPIRISTELVQLDVVVTDKNGRVVRGLTKDDFELYEDRKKQLISFFELVDAVKQRGSQPGQPSVQPSAQGLSETDVRRIFAFVVDDLTIRYEDLTYVRQMISNFIETQMQPTDLVAIVRTVGGKGLLQQFTTDKELLRRAVAALTPSTHPFSVFNNPEQARITGRPGPLSDGGGPAAGSSDTIAEEVDPISPNEDTNKSLRAFMSLGTASFVVDSMKQLPGRKSLVLISGGLPIFSSQGGTALDNISAFLNQLTDKATRSGVAIHTLDIRGLGAQSAVASFSDTPGRSGLTSSAAQMSTGASGNRRQGGELITGGSNDGDTGGFGRTVDQRQFGYNNPLDVTGAHMGLRILSADTGGISVLNKNDFNAGLERIVNTNEAYYLLAYTPSDNKFKGDFRRVEIKLKKDGLKVYSRRGYLAREDKPAAAPTTKEDQLLAAIKSPLARRDIEMDAMLLYKAAAAPDSAKGTAQGSWGAVDINLIVDPKKLQFEQVGDKQQTSYDVAGFVFDELGKRRGGFSETITAALTAGELKQVTKTGLSYSANTMLPPGTYQVRLAVRDNKSGGIGTMYRYIEVPDLSKGRLTASTLLLGAVPPNETTATRPTPITGNRQISRKQDVRYAVIIYNSKQKDGKSLVKTQLTISQNGQVIFKEPEEMLETTAKGSSQVVKVGQLGLSSVKPGRYTLTLGITDTLADKKAQTITRSMDFVVVN